MTMALATMLSLSSCLNDLGQTEQNRPEGGEDIVVNEDFEYVEGELFVKFSPEVEAMLGNIGRSGATRSGVPSVDEVLSIVDGYHIERVFPVDSRHEERTRKSGLHLWYIVKFKGEKASEVAKKFARLGEVQKVGLNYTIRRTYNGKSTPLSAEALTRAAAAQVEGRWNDPLLGYQWNIINDGTLLVKNDISKSLKDSDVQVEQAWKKTIGNPDIIVAVLDEGVWVNHPDLKASMWVNEDEIYGDSNDNDGNGYSGDYHGYNFTDKSGKINWARNGDTGHGTHVAGVIAAVNNNGTGISSIGGGNNGVGGVKIMSCQIFSGYNSTTAIQMIRAMKYAADNGAVIMQCSWGYNSGAASPYDFNRGYTSQEQWEAADPLQKEAMEYFIHQAGSPSGPIDGGITVWAAGNEYAPMAGFPGAADIAVSVAAIAADYTPASYTNYSTGVTISAPGGDQEYTWEYDAESVGQGINNIVDVIIGSRGGILSTMPLEFTNNSGYGYMDGTSMACPHVSGVLALAASYVADQRRIVKAEELQKLLHSTATKIEGLWPSHKMYYIYLQSIGKYMADEMTLSKYKGQMGSGLVNATALINALDGVGVPMTFPNVYVGLGEKATLVPARYFANGEKLTYTVTISNTDIASHTNKDGKLTFEGLKEGSTTATITTSGGVSQQFLITVRKGAGSLGWM